MRMLRKIFIGGVMLMTVLSMSIVVAPTAKAAAVSGDLIKANGLSSVYYLGANGERYVFPNEATYFSWFKDFSSVVTIPTAEMQSYPLAANVLIRPGTKLVKSPSIATVYAVSIGGVLQAIPSEADAISLYGANWAKTVVDVPDSFFVNYTVGAPLAVGQYPKGQLVKTSGSANVLLLASDGTARSFASEAAFTANNYNFNYVATVPSTFVMPTAGTAVSGLEATLDDVSQGGTAVGPVATGSGLTVALSSDTPASNTIPAGVSRIELLKFNVTASNDGDALLNSVTITRTGLGNRADFPTLWVEQAGVKLSSTKSINTSDQALITLSPALIIPAGKTITLSVFGSVAASSLGANDILNISAASDVVTSGAAVSGSFPISSNLVSFTTGYTVNQADVTVNTTAALTTNGTGANNTFNVGDEDVALGSFNIADYSATAGQTRDLVLKSVTLKNNGNAELATVASNLALEKSGVKVSESATVSGKNVTFKLANGGLTISKGDNVTLKVTGDVITEDTSNNQVQFMLNKSSDMDIEEVSSGYAATVSSSNHFGTFDSSAATFEFSYLTAGDITIAKDATSPTQKSYVKNTKNVVALLVNVKANQAFSADGMKLNLKASSTATDFSNVRLYVNDMLVDAKDITAGLNYLNYDSSVSINQGNNVIKVLADVNSDATDGSYVTLELNSSNAFTNPVYANDNSVSGITGVATAGKITVSTASLSATRSDGFADGDKLVAGTSDANLGSFTLQANNNDIKVTSISLSGVVGLATKLAASSVTNLKLMVGGVQIGSSKNLTTSGATFNLGSDAFTVAQGATKVVTLLGTIDSNSTPTNRLQTTLTFNGTDSSGKDLVSGSIPSANTVDFTIAGSGTLTIAKDGNAKIASLLAANSGNNEIASFKLTASDDTIKVNKLYISNLQGSGSDSRISSIDLYNGATLLGSAVPTNGQVLFDLSSNPVSIAGNTNVVLTAKVELTNITSAAQSGLHVQLAITGINANSSSGAELTSVNNANLLAYDDAAVQVDTTKNTTVAMDTATTTINVQTGSGIHAGHIIQVGSEQMLVIAATTGDTVYTVTRGINGTTVASHLTNADVYKAATKAVAANDFIIRKTIPTVVLQSLPNFLLTVGNQTIMKFTVSANQSSDVTVNSFIVATNLSGVTLHGATEGSLKINGTVLSTAVVTTENAGFTNSTSSVANVVVDLSSAPVIVSAGTSKTFEVVLNVTGVNTSGGATASITSKINEDASGAAATINASSFVWSDNANVTTPSADWANSFEVPALPTDSQSLTTG